MNDKDICKEVCELTREVGSFLVDERRKLHGVVSSESKGIHDYVIYVFASYKRIEDNLALEVHNEGIVEDFVEVGREYSIQTYNIGFGAYLQDYSFFMDGGESVYTADENRVNENLDGILEEVKELNPDIILFQEIDKSSSRSYKINEYNMWWKFILVKCDKLYK